MSKKNSTTKVALTGNIPGNGAQGSMATALDGALYVAIDMGAVLAGVAKSLPISEKKQIDELNAAARELRKDADGMCDAWHRKMDEARREYERADRAYNALCARVEGQTYKHFQAALRTSDWMDIKATALLAKGNCVAEEQALKLQIQKAVEAALMGEIKKTLGERKSAEALVKVIQKEDPTPQAEELRALARRNSDEALILLEMIKTGDANNG